MFSSDINVENHLHEITNNGQDRYVILEYESSRRLQKAVNMAIDKWGYKPIGGVSHLNTSICFKSYQAMYK